MTRYVADCDAKMCLVDQKKVIKIAPDLRGRRHIGINRVGIVIRKIIGKDSLLNTPRDLQFRFRG